MNPSLRRRVIDEWRGLPSERPPPARTRSTADILPKVMQKLGLEERLRETEVVAAWTAIVGDFIATHSAPIALREGVLYVPGAFCCPPGSPRQSSAVRLCFAPVAIEQIPEAVRRLARAAGAVE